MATYGLVVVTVFELVEIVARAKEAKYVLALMEPEYGAAINRCLSDAQPLQWIV